MTYISKNNGYLHKLPSVIENANYKSRLAREHDALTESEKRYRTLFESNQIVMLLTNPENGQIVDANPAAEKFYGLTHKQLISKTIEEISVSDSKTIVNGYNNITENKPSCLLSRHQCSDDTICDVEIYNSPIEIDGKPLLHSIIYNITDQIKNLEEKEKLQKQLMQAQKMEAIGTLAGGIAHDFNNILTAIIGFAQLNMNSFEEDSSIKEDLKEIHTAGLRARDLVQQILSFARQSDDEVYSIQPIHILKEALKLLRSTVPSSIDIRQDLVSKSYIIGSGIQMHQVIMNLCTNAAHAMEKDGGVLKISLKDAVFNEKQEMLGMELKSGDYLELKVSDTGNGMSQETCESIFEPYFTTKPMGEGTGMGLATVYGIVKQYGGGLQVDSEPGKGSIFTIFLPVSIDPKKKQEQKTSPPPTGVERILIIDDEISITKMLKKTIDKLGYETVVETNSLNALKLFQSKPDYFDLVITDMTMPMLEGDRLSKEILKIKPDIPILLCTGFSKKVSKDTVSQIGIKGVIKKPFDYNKLGKIIRTTIDHSKKVSDRVKSAVC